MQTLHCKAILLNLPCKIKCFYRKFCRSYTTPAKFLCFTALNRSHPLARLLRCRDAHVRSQRGSPAGRTGCERRRGDVYKRQAVEPSDQTRKTVRHAPLVYRVEEIAQLLAISNRAAYNLCNTTKDFKVIRLGSIIIRICNEQKPCLLLPSCAYLLSSLQKLLYY